MKENLECKVVEDLLLNYLDGSLNEETKEMVEKHFLQCDECKQKVERLKQNLLEEKENDKKCVDYLKKAKKKERIRTVKWIIFFILIVVIFIFLYRSIITNKIIGKTDKIMSNENIYVERVEHITGNSATVDKIYYKNGKYKKVSEIYYSDNTIVPVDTTYLDMNKNEFKESFSSLLESDGVKDRLYKIFTMSIFCKVKSDNIDVLGKENIDCYVFTDTLSKQKRKMWFDKDTGLLIKEISDNLNKSYYNDESGNYQYEIWKEMTDQIIEYKYEFNVVTDTDVEKR